MHGHTGANVYKGMVGLMPIYDPKTAGRAATRRTDGLRLPGRPRATTPDGTFDVDYDIPLAFYDCRLDDGVTPHKDAHNGSRARRTRSGGARPSSATSPTTASWATSSRSTARRTRCCEVKRRKYRLRFLDASISRIYDFELMTLDARARSRRASLGYTGDELQGQYRLPDGQQCMKLDADRQRGRPAARRRSSATTFELWPAKRREFIVDFTALHGRDADQAGRRDLPRRTR